MFGKYIQRIRKEQGYTLSQLANLVGISKSYLSNIERDIKRNPSIHIMEKIAYALKIDLTDILQQGTTQVSGEMIESEWVDFMNAMKNTGIDKEQIQDYKILIEFIKWHNEKKRLRRNEHA